MDKHLALKTPPPQKILIIAMRFLGDVLLATPLIHSIRLAHPKAKIDVLIYNNTAAMVEGNPDIDEAITTPERPKFSDYKTLYKQIFRKYDLSIVTQTNDRRLLYGILAAPTRIAFTPKRDQKGWWKRYLTQAWTEFEPFNNHTVLELLKLSSLMNIEPNTYLVPPTLKTNAHTKKQLNLPPQYAVLHVYPQWQYKRWTTTGWSEVAHHLNKHGITPILSGSSAQEERTYISRLQPYLPSNTINLAGQLTLAELTHIIQHSKLFIGPDTGITHLAAATGVPVIAIYGPTNPVIWGPWPYAYKLPLPPYKKTGNQTVNNIHLVQGKASCIPCQEEGCDKHRKSYSHCLDTLPSTDIKHVINNIISTTKGS